MGDPVMSAPTLPPAADQRSTLRVLYVSHTSQISGGERSLLDLLRGLPPSIQPLVACPQGPLAATVRELGVPVHDVRGTDGSLRLHPLHTPRAISEMFRSAMAVRRIASAAAADVVHANSIRAGLMVTGARRRGGPPTLVQVRDRLPRGQASNLSLGAIARGTDLIVANSRYTAQSLSSRPSVRVVASPVDLERFNGALIGRDVARATLGLPDDDLPVLSVIAQLTPWKGQDDAIRALGLLRELGCRARLLVVGDVKFASNATRYDNRAYRAGLERLVDELGLSGDVIFTGELEDVPLVLSATDVLLVPSWEEPFGRTVIEGMAMGVPVVATSVGGPAEIVTDGHDGILLVPRRPDLWAAALCDLLARPEHRARIARRGLTTAASYSREHHVGAIVGLYRELAPSRA